MKNRITMFYDEVTWGNPTINLVIKTYLFGRDKVNNNTLCKIKK